MVTPAPVRDDSGAMDPTTAAFVRFRSRGDLDALGAVFDAQAPRLLALALHLCGNAADAEDALQATFVVAMQKADAFDASQPIGPWLAGILAGEARNAARRTRRVAAAPPERASASDPAADAERRELVATLRTHIEALPMEQRQVLLLQLQHGLQPAEIAEVVGASPGTVRMRLHRGLAALRGVLPASLVAIFASLLPARGIAAVRVKVLREAARYIGTAGAAATTAATAIAGVLAVFAAVVVVATFVAAPWSVDDAREPSAPAVAAAVDTRAATDAAPGRGARDEPPPAADVAGARVAAAVERRPLNVVVRAAMRMANSHGASFMGGPWCPPVPDVDVVVWPDPAGGLEGPTLRARTNERGRVEWPDVPVGRFHLRVRCGKSEVGAKEVVVDAAVAATTVELDLMHGGMVNGRVIDAAGQPVAGAEIWTGARFEPREWSALQLRRAAVSGRDGLFQCCPLAEEASIVARHDGHATSPAWPLSRSGDGPMTLVLGERAGAVRVLVRGAAGEQLPELSVAVQPTAAPLRRAADGSPIAPSLPVQARVLPDGTFLAEGLAAGAHDCRVQASGRAVAAAVEVVAGQVTDVAIDLAFGMAVRGRVRDPSRKPCAGFMVSLTNGAASRTVLTDERGKFAFENVERAPFTLCAMRGGAVVATRDVLPSLAGESCDLEAAVPTLRGHVVDTAGNGLSGLRVAVRRAGDPVVVASAKTGFDGSFVLCGVPDGALDLAVGDDAAPLVRATHASLGEPATLVVPDDRMPRSVVLGRVVDELGQPLTDAQVTIDDHPSFDFVFGLHEGRFRFERVRDGTFALRVSAPDRVPLCLRREAHGGEPCDLGDIVSARGAELHVRLLRPDGSAWREQPPAVRVEPVGGGDPAGEQRIDTDGTVVVSGLAPGRHRITGPQDDELLVEPQVVDLCARAPVDVVLPTAVGRRCELRFEHAPDDVPIDVKVRRADGRVVLQKSLIRTEHPLACVLPLGELVVEASRGGVVTHRAAITVGSNVGDPSSSPIPRLH